ncbi:MAG: cell wall metabolism sensor histidine kinase WalK [Defluviitaleaceae bacterium]|nr:cell wall metabolism sensor histidine kinase WalK [Defluviitaleaceae bacterium]MCL2261886.1 cell wall metabolism sensor histidine kinase WalK [Defluviitaleaceae bacterium]
MHSLKSKLIAIYAAVVLVVMTVSGTFMLLTVRTLEIDQARESLFIHAVMIYEQVVQRYDRTDFLDAHAWISIGAYEIEGVLLTDIGQPLAPLQFVHAGTLFNDSTLAEAMTGSEAFSVGNLGLDIHGAEQRWFTFAMPVSDGGDDFIIFTRLNTRFMNERLAGLTLTFVVTVLVALVVTFIFWIFLGNTITRPIVALTKHAKAIANGDFSGKLKVVGKDEIGQLTANFDNMSKELRATLGRIVSEKNKVEAFMQNTSHGVLAYDVGGRLLHANIASSELLQGMDINNVDMERTLRFFGFEPYRVLQIRPGEVLESVYEDEDYYLYACITTYTSETDDVDGFVIVLQDITRQSKLENMRKEFVANVSHELRTPLTNVKTYAETLLDGALEDPETARSFLKVINDEAERMSLLVSDLLELSRIDSKHAALEMDVVDLVALLRLAIRQAQILADKKDQKIKFLPPPSVCFIEANAARINQVVSNILSNSVKYSSENTTIEITMELTEKYYRVYIKDNGMGIPPESLNRIFERFYRVDKARARALGGTGLGLAIVKEIMEEHGGRVSVSSQPGVGTTMVLRFNRMGDEV